MTKRFVVAAFSVSAILVQGCAAPDASLTYHPAATAGLGYPFAIPRTVVKVSPGDKGSLTFTTVPVTYGADNQALPQFVLSDASGSQFALTPTTLTSIKYADSLVISSIGTQVVDNRTAALNASFSLLGIVGKAAGFGFAAAVKEDCAKVTQPPAFAIDSFDSDVKGAFVPGTPCWGYDIKIMQQEVGPGLFPVSGDTTLPVDQAVNWFPYPACRTVMIGIYQCDPNNSSVCTPIGSGNSTVTTLNVSLGKQYRRMKLPVKGTLTLHADFCVADITNDSSGFQNGWSLLQQAITDYQGLKQTNNTSSTSSKK